MADPLLLLPREMLQHLFSLLPLSDLSSCVLVCRLWREVGEQPSLWRRLHMPLHFQNLGVIPLLADPFSRLAAVTKVTFYAWLVPCSEARAVLEAVQGHPGGTIRELTVRGNYFWEIPASLVSSCFTRMSRVVLNKAKLSSRQLKELLTTMSQGSTIKELELADGDLCKVEAGTLASALTSLEKVSLDRCPLLRLQARALFQQLARPASSLQELRLHRNELTYLPVRDLENVHHLAVMDLSACKLKREQVLALLLLLLVCPLLLVTQVTRLLESAGKGTKLKMLDLR